MKLLKLFFLLLLGVISFTACEEANDIDIDESNKLKGYWVKQVYSDSVYRYQRESALEANEYGFAFKLGKVFIERKNSGWCGTPPIAYGDFEGTWDMKSDSVITITVEYWGGLADYEWKIISLDDNYLTIYPIEQKYHQEGE